MSRNAIEDAVSEHHLTTIEDVTALTVADANCGACLGEIQEILYEMTE